MPSLPAALAALSPTFVYVPAQAALKPGGGVPAAGDTIGTISDLSASARDATAAAGFEAKFRGTPSGVGWAEFPSTDTGAAIATGSKYNCGASHTPCAYFAALVRGRNAWISGSFDPLRNPKLWNTNSAPVAVGVFGPFYNGFFTNQQSYVNQPTQPPRAVWRNGLDLSATTPIQNFLSVEDWHIQEWSCNAPASAKEITLGWNTAGGNGYVSAMDLAGVVCLGSDPTTGQRLTVRQYLAGLVPWVNVNFFGNSRFANDGTAEYGTNAQTNTLPTLVRTDLRAAESTKLWGIYPNGNPGETATTMSTQVSTQVSPLVALDAAADIVCLTEGYNEAGQNFPDSGSFTAAQAAQGAFNALKSLGLSIKAKGPKVLYGTEFSAVLPQRADWDTAVTGTRARLLALVLADPSWYDGLVRQDLIPNIGGYGAVAADVSHTYWNDGVHLNNNGHAVVAPYWTTGIRTLAAPAGGAGTGLRFFEDN